MKIPPQRLFAGIAGLASLAWLSMTAAVAAGQRKLIFNPVRAREVAHPRSAGHRTRTVVLRSPDGTRLSGWLMSPKAPGRHPAVLYFGGRSEEVSWVARDAGRMFPDMTVLAINYRGYGDSFGVPDELHMIADARMLYDWVAEHHHVDPSRIAVVGRSLGSGVAIRIAVERPVAALVLLTPYDSLVAIAQRRFRSLPINWVMRHRFESVKYAASLQAPVLVLRAASDDIIPASHTDLLVAKLGSAPEDVTIPESDHCNIVYLKATQECIAAFLAARFAKPAPLGAPTQVLAETTATAPAIMPGLPPALS
jgi:dipeptidyl aminopeptidase/acylaminoacyl peptidase